MFICVVLVSCVEIDMKIHVGPIPVAPSYEKKADEMGENEGIRKKKEGELSAANLSQRDEEGGGGNGSQP